jgi:hypothetical protein
VRFELQKICGHRDTIDRPSSLITLITQAGTTLILSQKRLRPSGRSRQTVHKVTVTENKVGVWLFLVDADLLFLVDADLFI